MFSRNFWKQSVERAAKSAAQALLGTWALDGFNALDADYRLAAGIVLGAVILSVLTSIVSSQVGESDTPSLVRTPRS